MASRIITKKGSGAPLASDLVHGELAVDTVNKRLYTENAGGSIIELGTAPSTIDINGGTIDGTVIGGSSAAAGTFTTISASGEIAANGGVALPDGGQATFGAGDDLKIYHTGSHSYIDENGTGNLYIGSNNGAGVYIQGSGETLASFLDDGAATLYYDNAAKLATTATGIDVTGTASADQLNSNNGKLFLDDNGSHNGVINAPASLYVNFDSDNTSASEKIVFGYDRDGTSGGTSVMEISSTGIDVTGTVTADGLTVDGTDVFFNSGWIKSTGSLRIDVDNDNNQTDRAFIVSSDAGVKSIFLASEGGDISLFEDTGTTAKLFWDASAESLGIGTTSPATALEVKGDGTSIQVSSADYDVALLGRRGSSGVDLDKGYMRLRDTGTTTVAIDSAGNSYFNGGNVGIGTSSPAAKLDIAGETRIYPTSGTAVLRFGSGGVEKGKLSVDTSSNMVFETAGSERMRIDSSGNLLVGKTSAGINGEGFEASSSGYMAAVRNGGTAAYFQRKTSDGEIVNFRKDGTTVGSITVTTSATAYNTSSDYRLKENVVSMDNASNRVLALKPCRFNFVADPDKTVDGFLAHEAQEVVPEAVTGSKDAMRTEEYEVSPAVYEDVIIPAVEEVLDEEGNVITEAQPERTEQRLVSEAVISTREVPDYQGIDQSKLVPLLTKALQEALQRIEALEAKLA